MQIDILTLAAKAQCSTMNIVKPRPEVTPERNAEVFRMAHMRDPKYWDLVNEISKNVINEMGNQ